MKQPSRRPLFALVLALGLIASATYGANDAPPLSLTTKPDSTYEMPLILNTERFISSTDYAVGAGLSLLCTAIPLVVGGALITDFGNAGTTSGILIAFSGLTLGPSAIQFYNGYAGHAWAAATLRLAGEITVLAAFANAISNIRFDFSGNDDREDRSSESSLRSGLIVGGLLYGGGVLYSLMQPATHIRPHHAKPSTAPLKILPRFEPKPQGRSQYGLAANLSF